MPIIVLSGSEDTDLMRSLMDLGVLGFIPKAYSPDVMLSAIRLVLAGGTTGVIRRLMRGWYEFRDADPDVARRSHPVK